MSVFQKKFFGLGLFILVFLSGCGNADQETKNVLVSSSSTELEKLVAEEQKNKGKISAGLSIQKISEDDKKVIFDIILSNPQEEKIQSVQSWFTYPIKILEGSDIEILASEVFDFTAPGEKNFDRQNGLVKIGISRGGKAQKTEKIFPLARITFLKKSSSPYLLEFYNTGGKGNTKVMSFTPSGIRNILDPQEIKKYTP